jgi:hypothetical protein
MHARIGTWNVAYAAGEERNRLRHARLMATPADVWVLTETHDALDLSETHAAVSTLQRETGRPGGRWTTIWTRWPVLRHIDVDDPHRTVAALLESPLGVIAVYGTVLPWHSDPGPGEVPAKSWAEQDRILPLQLAEWRRICDRFRVPLVVAGDLNMNLGGPHYYGTARGRQALRDGLADLGLACATETDRIPSGMLAHPPIDHVVVPHAWLPTSRVVAAWNGTDEVGRKLSDHSGVVVEVEG